MGDYEDAVARLSRTTAMSAEQAAASLASMGMMPPAAPIDAAKWEGSMTAPNTETDPYLFMTAENLTKQDLGEALREYRDMDTGYYGSPWENDIIGVLSADFINWYRWERL